MRGFLVSTGDADTWILDLDPPPDVELFTLL